MIPHALIAAAAIHGATVEDESGARETRFQIIAPEGKRWIESGCNAIVVSTFDRKISAELLQAATAEMATGLEDDE